MTSIQTHQKIHLLLLVLLCHVVCPAPLVPAPWGSIQGVDIEGQGGKKMNGYLGIPFALPPTGELRWQKPRPHPGPGEGQVFVADTFQPACPQEVPGMGVYNGISEDCLTLNVFVPIGADKVTSPLPVMIFIHGGGFSLGDAPIYRPTKLVADGGVIVVTIQYRLGTLGFLATGDDLVKGNFGFWDQTMAIRWVTGNIRAFGGDPKTITLFGESAGGMSVGFHTVSPQSRGLFRRAILQSGTPNALSGILVNETDALIAVSRALDCERHSSAEMVQCLKTRSADDIANVTSLLLWQNPNFVLFMPRVDGEWMPRDPLELLQDEQYVRESGVGDLDIVVGTTNNEGALLVTSQLMRGAPLEVVTDPAFFAPMLQMCVALGNKGRADEILKRVVEFYYRGADSFTNNSVPVTALTQMYGDALFYAPTVQWLRALVSQPHAGARYMYLFDHDFKYNEKGPAPGTQHGDDLVAEFEILMPEDSFLKKLNKTGLAPEEEPLSDLFVKTLTDFAKTGNPSPGLRDSLDGDWPEFTPENEAYLSLSLTPRVQRYLYKKRMALWLNLLPQISGDSQRPQGKQPSSSSEKDEL